MVIGSCYGNPVKREVCQQPTEEALEALLLQYTPNALSFATTSGSYSPPSSTSCPVSYGPGASLDIRSTCPYYNIEDTDTDRYPQTLVEAECYSCQNCITDLLESSDYHPMWRCEKVMTPELWVLRNTYTCDSEGFYEYTAMKTRIPFMCTCGRERV
ncbi:interleukin 17-like protein [Ptychodera flava]|uniref:interleukin 17-like protein n=1 Tax=Ptychodera flava TaxID=63121 RepID=UPI00396A792C